MNIQKYFSMALLLLFFSSIANANLLELEPGWPRLVDNDTKITNHFEGITAHFEAENMGNGRGNDRDDDRDRRRDGDRIGRAPYFKEGPGVPRVSIDNPEFSTWADIRVQEDNSLQVLDGLFEVSGKLELGGDNFDGVLFSASLLDVAWDAYTIAFEMGSDHQGYLCDLGFCSSTNELLQFNLTSNMFDGDFGQDFDMTAQTVATVPVPAAVWLFGIAMLGLGGLRKNQMDSKRILS